MERRGNVNLSPNLSGGRGLLVDLASEGVRIRTAVTDRRRAVLNDALREPVPDGFDRGLAAILDRLDQGI